MHGFDEEPDWDFELLNPPPELELIDENLLFNAPWGSGGETVDFTVRITHLDSGVSHDVQGRFDIMAADVLVQGYIGSAGGEIENPDAGVRLVVPPNAVDSTVLFLVVRGLAPDGSIHYTVHTEPQDTELYEPLELYLPDPDEVDSELLGTQALDATRITPRFISPQWTEWNRGRAHLLQSNILRLAFDGRARNRIPSDTDWYPHVCYLPFARLTRSCTSSVYDLIWRLSSRCGAPTTFAAGHECFGKPPVLLVHGYQRFATFFGGAEDEILKGGDDYWNDLPQLLEDAGYAVFGFQWRSSQRFEDAAADLAQAIADIRAATGQPVHIIAHSFGGLVARTYLQGLATDQPYEDDVVSLVTIGTPHSGIADEGVVTIEDEEDEGVVIDMRLPRGRSQAGTGTNWACRQLSCYQAGRAHRDTYEVRLGFSDIDLREYFGVDPNHAGALPVKLANSSHTMPVPMKALYGLTSGCPSSYALQIFGPGDGLISWEGQRAHPRFSCPSLNQVCAATTINATGGTWQDFPAGLTERVLGLSAAHGGNVKPGNADNVSGAANAVPFYCTRWGYRHSPSFPVNTYGSLAQMDITQDNHTDHAVYNNLLAWLSSFATGSLRVTLEPAAARDAGAQWRRANTNPWFDSGTTETGIPVGGQTVEFKAISNWTAPSNAAVSIRAGETKSLTRSYEAETTDPGDPPPPATGRLNDTGIDWCADGSSNNLACPVALYPGQDGDYGRDAAARAGTLDKVGDGAAGFDYTKLDANGNDLPASALNWSCVRDNHTGLIWEVKVDDPGHLRHKDHRYTWYNPNSPDGNPGSVGDTSSCNNTLGGKNCNTANYVTVVNVQGLCGATDWRMPTWQELQGIVDYGRFNPAIDTEYFPNTPSSGFLSGSPALYNVSGFNSSDLAWEVRFSTGVANDAFYRGFYNRVRLVRGAD